MHNCIFNLTYTFTNPLFSSLETIMLLYYFTIVNRSCTRVNLQYVKSSSYWKILLWNATNAKPSPYTTFTHQKKKERKKNLSSNQIRSYTFEKIPAVLVCIVVPIESRRLKNFCIFICNVLKNELKVLRWALGKNKMAQIVE